MMHGMLPLVTLKPVGGLISNSPGTAQQQIDVQKRELEKQAKLDEMREKLAQQHRAKTK